MSAARQPGAGYQVLLVALLSLNFGIVFFDRNALSFLWPRVQPELGLTNTEVGLVGSALSFTWAASGFLLGSASDRFGRRKAFLVAATVVFSLASFLTGIASSFAMLLGIRMLMGAAEGSVMPLSQSLVASAVAPRHRGLAMGSMQTTGAALLGTALAPILVEWLAAQFGWRNAFYLAGAPGIVCAALMWGLIREPDRAAAEPAKTGAPGGLLEVLGRRNILVCSGLAILLVSYMLITWTFMQLYLVQVQGLDTGAAAGAISVLGLSAATFGVVVPFVSDRIGRKPVMIFTPLLGVLLPLAALYGGGSGTTLAAAFFVGWALAGTFAMFMATIPAETVPPAYIATAMGLVTGLGEAVGGVAGPALAGMAADAAGLPVVMWIMLGLAIAGSVLALGLEETAPAVLARRAGAAQPVAAQ